MYTMVQIQQQITDEVAGFRHVQELQRCGREMPALLERVRVDTREQAVVRAVETAQRILRHMHAAEMSYAKTDAGHGLGHVVRDYVNGLRLASKLDVDPRELFVGLVAGILHDSACGAVRRYDDHQSIVKHAGFASIIVEGICAAQPDQCGLNLAERQLIQYGIAAHTHATKETRVTGKDGVTRILDPYPDTDENGKPYLAVWLPRWIDRLDCNGPTFVARHYLTLAEAHQDFANNGYYPIEYASHMRPLLRSADAIKADGNRRTMLEHLKMFRDSQSNASPYGKHDVGAMVVMRDRLTVLIDQVFEDIAQGYELKDWQQTQVLKAWDDFLANNIEPHPAVGRPTAERLSALFAELPAETRMVWTIAFELVMYHYCEWAKDVLNDLDEMPREWLRFLDIEDVRTIIRPHRSWAAPIGLL